MKIIIRLFGIMLLLALIFTVEFVLLSDTFVHIFNQEKLICWFTEAKYYAWIIGIICLILDILLPIPASGVMAALGNVYGIALGSLISFLGSFGAGVTGYVLAWFLGRKGSSFLATNDELERFQKFFNDWGGLAIIVSRIFPILPEIMTILAGLIHMHPVRFVVALILGTLPTSIFFVSLGYFSKEEPILGLAAAIVFPLLIWPFFLKATANHCHEQK